MNLHRTLAWMLLGGCAVIGPCAAAQPSASYSAYAQVVKIVPVLSRSQTREPVKLCTWELLPSRTRYNRDTRERRVTERRVKRCRTQYRSRVNETITAYNVTLSYNGETFIRRTTERPGTSMPVSIEISPLDK